jgi:hypothetical protein
MTESVGNETIEKYWCFSVSLLALTGCFNVTGHLKKNMVVFNDIRAVSIPVCWHHLLFQFSNFEFSNLAIYLDAAN